MSNSIKFDHGENGKLPVSSGSTSFGTLFAIGAIDLTATYSNGYREYATDKDGLELMSGRADEAISFLNSSTHALGVLLAHADHSEVAGEMTSIGWLIAGFGELSEMVRGAKDDIDYALKIADQQAQKSPDK